LASFALPGVNVELVLLAVMALPMARFAPAAAALGVSPTIGKTNATSPASVAAMSRALVRFLRIAILYPRR
jgi:hypothetical protein